MNKLTMEQLEKTKGWKEAVIVFTPNSFSGIIDFTEEERSYKVSSDAKWFDSSMIGMSLWGNCLDGKDLNVRLDRYMRALPSEGKWYVEYCYITD